MFNLGHLYEKKLVGGYETERERYDLARAWYESSA